MITRVLIKNRNIKFSRLFSSVVQTETHQKEPVEYPVIEDVSKPALKIKKKLEWRNKIQKCPTIEEKIIELNIPRYYGYKCIMFENNDFPYNALPFVQYVTKTDFEEIDGNSKISQDEKEAKKIDGFLDLIKSDVLDAIEFEIDAYRSSSEDSQRLSKEEIERAKVSRLVKQLNRVLTNALGADNRHLYESDIDIDPRVEAFWFVGKFIPPLSVQKFRERREYLKQTKEEPVDRSFQYVGRPLLTVRHQNPLEPFEHVNFDIMTEQNKNIATDVASFDPLAFGYHTNHRHGVTVPGFWPGNVREYGLLAYHDRTQLFKRSKVIGIDDTLNGLHSQGVMSSFAYAYAQACYQGFSTYNDMTYPLVAQTVITDGQHWSFYKYQLNTTIMHTELDQPNYKYNKCFGTNEMKLYEHVDENGKIHGFNDNVLRHLIKFYINEPKLRNYEMKPYLDPKERKIADIEDVDRREWLEKTFKYLVSNRPRQYLVPEIYNWEYIYKIKFQTMPMDKKLRFFEYGINPFQRNLSEHIPEYIPRHLRPNGIHDKKKRRATYYPLDHCSNDPRIMSHSLYGAAKEGIRRKFDRFRKTFK